MPPETTAPAPVATPAAPAADTAAARAAKEKASADKWGAVAAASLGVGEAPEAEPAPAEKPRAKDGKFVADKSKAKEKTDGKATEAKAAPEAVLNGKEKPKLAANGRVAEADGKAGGKAVEEPAASGVEVEPQPEFVGGLGKAKRLAREGKVAEALKLIDLDPEKIPGGAWASWRKANDKRDAEIARKEADILEAHQKVKDEARELVAQLRPFAQAKEALESGDEDRVFELVFGKTVDEWQRGRLAKMHRGDLSKDPAVVEATRRAKAAEDHAAQLRKELEERDQKTAEREQQAAVEKRQVEYREELKEQFAASDDPRLQAAAELPWFIKMVHKEQLDSYKFDPRTRQEDYLTVEEAIERVYDPERLTAAQWKQLTGELSSTVERVPGTKTQVATDRRVNDVKRVAQAPTSLSRSATVEAAPERRRSEKESLAYWSGQAAKTAAQGK